MNKITIMAHRGASHDAPENTRAAFIKAASMQACGIETDLHLTADNEIVVHHNYFVNDTSNGEGAVAMQTLSALKKLDFGMHKGEAFAGEQILTLEELLNMKELSTMKVINLELKSHLRKEVPFVEKVLDVVEKSEIKDKVIFSSFDENLLRQIKEIKPEYKVGLLTFHEKAKRMMQEMTAVFLSTYPGADVEKTISNVEKKKNLMEIVDNLDFKIDYLHPDYHSVLETPELVTEMHKRGIGVNPYTCDIPEEIEKLAKAGCDGIITNRPDKVKEALKNWENKNGISNS